MLLATMDDAEVTLEFRKDYSLIQEKSFKGEIQKKIGQYIRDRKKLKINKRIEFRRVYSFTSRRNNNWIIVMNKDPDMNSFNGYSVSFTPIVYYYTSKGLRAFTILEDNLGLAVYNGHFFERYNERKGLMLKTPEDMIKHFFKNNLIEDHPIVGGEFLRDGDRAFSLGTCASGITLGEYHRNNIWLIYKTFITAEQAFPDQTQFERDLLANHKSVVNEAKKLQTLRIANRF
jgi:hypothetical protein